jgi:hypothetical protein
VSPVRYELGFYVPEEDILHSHRRENLKPYKDTKGLNVRQRSYCPERVRHDAHERFFVPLSRP